MNAAPSTTYMFDGMMTARAQLATCGPSLNASKKDKNDPTPIPTFANAKGTFMYMPGAGMRSKLRGAATMITLAAARARGGMPILLKDAQYLRLGGIKQAGTEEEFNSLEHEKLLASNPLISVFGASTPWVTGKIMVSHLSCVDPVSVVKPMQVDGTRTSMLRRNPGIMEFLDPTAVKDYQSQVEGVKDSVAFKKELKALEDQIKSARKTAPETLDDLKSKLNALKKDDDSRKVVSEQQPLPGYLAIPPGSELTSTIRLLNATQIELGCLIASLEQFALNPLLGAHMAHGAGEVEATWQVRAAGGREVGTVTVEPFIGLKVDGQELIDAKAAFEDFLRTSDLFEPRAPKIAEKEDKASKKAKAKAAEGDE